MNVELSKRDKDTANKKEGRELKNQDTTGSIRRVRQRKFRSTWEREKNNGEIQRWEPEERKQVLDGRRGKKVQNVL
jgi:hypothetical protein